ncbi:hypothetical protein [Brevundimonas sp.]|uniref:hypothetical protein n=1 Tax=Brevundimonas sp. TaxID=1871086 RepID=UPI00289CFCBB|nr:hypothetical protein [Brevundimonas sp.]
MENNLIEVSDVNTNLDSHLIDEYKIIQQRWDNFDQRVLLIKGTVSGFSLISAPLMLSQAPYIQIKFSAFAICILLSTWILEWFHRGWQAAYRDRIFKIEKHFRGDIVLKFAWQTQTNHDEWSSSHQHHNYRRASFLDFSISLPYLPIIILLLLQICSAYNAT